MHPGLDYLLVFCLKNGIMIEITPSRQFQILKEFFLTGESLDKFEIGVKLGLVRYALFDIYAYICLNIEP
jgi:hypothetical protein